MKRVILLFVVGLGFLVGYLTINIPLQSIPATVDKQTLASADQNDKFLSKMNTLLNQQARKNEATKSDADEDDSSVWYTMFNQPFMSSNLHRTYSPKIVAGGIDSQNQTFEVKADNGAVDGNQEFLITGTVGSDQTPKIDKVVRIYGN